MTYELLHNGQFGQVVRTYASEQDRLANQGRDLIRIVNNVMLPESERRCSQGWQATLIEDDGRAFNVNRYINQHDGARQIAGLFGL